MLIVDKHYRDVPQIDRKGKQVKEQTWKILFAISMGRNGLF